MNERIRELAKQARKYADENEEHWKPGLSWGSLFEGKFTELMVKECLVQVQDEVQYEYGWELADIVIMAWIVKDYLNGERANQKTG